MGRYDLRLRDIVANYVRQFYLWLVNTKVQGLSGRNGRLQDGLFGGPLSFRSSLAVLAGAPTNHAIDTLSRGTETKLCMRAVGKHAKGVRSQRGFVPLLANIASHQPDSL